MAVALAGLAVAGCGSSSKSSSSTTPAATPTTSSSATTSSSPSSTAAAAPAPAAALKLAANSEGQLKFEASTLAAKAGRVTIEFTNAAPLAHNVTVGTASGSVLGATPTFTGGSRTLTLNLKAGTYKFFCTVPGHRAAGMEGTLTVH
jgi:plastocyanin